MTQLAEIIPEIDSLSPAAELRASVKLFSEYNSILNEIWTNLSAKNKNKSSIDGRSANTISHLRRIIPLHDLREAGSFFTCDDLADEAVSRFSLPITTNSVVLDPACGAGNLLIACSKKLPVTKSLFETMANWGHVLSGWDIFPEFVETTKLRLILEGINRGCSLNGVHLSALKDLLFKIRQTNALVEMDTYSIATHVIMNPPYNRIPSPKKCSWGSGKINAAGLFFEHMLTNVSSTTDIVAVLPDVLRSGTRYQRWRELLRTKLPNCTYTIVGRFDSKTNVDVFILSKETQEGLIEANPGIANRNYSTSRNVSHFFYLFVGPVVPHRDPEAGEVHPYIYPKMLPKWQEVNEFTNFRRFTGRLFQPPFVVIRRTSAPTDKARAGATIIRGSRPVAVENHLIVAVPKEGGDEQCRTLMRILQDEKTSDFLNDRIRCRHLTVGSISEIPWSVGV